MSDIGGGQKSVFSSFLADFSARRARSIVSVFLEYPSCRQKITFCAIKSLILNGSCSNFEHFSLKIGHIFLPSLKTLSSKIKIIYLSIIKNLKTC